MPFLVRSVALNYSLVRIIFWFSEGHCIIFLIAQGHCIVFCSPKDCIVFSFAQGHYYFYLPRALIFLFAQGHCINLLYAERYCMYSFIRSRIAPNSVTYSRTLLAFFTSPNETVLLFLSAQRYWLIYFVSAEVLFLSFSVHRHSLPFFIRPLKKTVIFVHSRTLPYSVVCSMTLPFSFSPPLILELWWCAHWNEQAIGSITFS